MTKITSKQNIFYSLLATITALALITPAMDTSIRSYLAEGAPAQTFPTPPGPYFPPTPEFTADELDSYVNSAKNVAGIKAWSDKWQYNYADFSGTSVPVPKWETMVLHLYLPSSVSAPKACDIGWEAIVVYDLASGKITHSYYPDMATACHRAVVVLGDPEAAIKENLESNNLLPTAQAAVTRNGYAVATQEDILGLNVLKGTISDILTPAFSGQFSHMDRFVGQTINARFDPTPGVKFLQSGWVISHSGCTSSCGDLVTPDTKVLVWADSSVSPFNSDAHVFGYPNPPAWVNGQTLTAEVICSGGTTYKEQAAYGIQLFTHTSTVPCSTAQQGNEFSNSVFFENANTVASSSWSGDITSTVRANNASELLNGVWKQWQTSKDKDVTCTGSVRDPSTVMTGNIKLGGTATWSTLSNMPIRCTT